MKNTSRDGCGWRRLSGVGQKVLGLGKTRVFVII